MPFDVPDNRRESLERLVYELENTKLSVRRQAAELLAYRDLVSALRKAKKLPPAVYAALKRIPLLSDKEAWDRLSAEEQRDAAIEALEEELKR
jgi:hypothetical protein